MTDQSKALNQVLSDLNDEQRAAACHGDNPLLIIAGAGTGKTTTLTHRVAYLIASGVDPGRIMLLTFTRRASREMLRRVERILRDLASAQRGAGERNSQVTSRKIWGGTFHAIAARMLRQHARLIGLDPGFSIIDRSDAEDLMNVIRTQSKFGTFHKRFPLKQTCLSIYSRCVNAQQKLSTVLHEVYPWCVDFSEELNTLFRKYTDSKQAQACLDFDDLLLFWNQLLVDPTAQKLISKKFDHVLVDEYQDTNRLQADLLKRLSPNGSGLTVVGDDAQSIYSFRAATVHNILDFPKQFSATTVVKLEENYRSRQPILDATNRVIAQASQRFAKNLWSRRKEGEKPVLVYCEDEFEQTDVVLDKILAHREAGTPLQQQAVLFRTSHHSLQLEVELQSRNIPFHKYGGLKFIEAAHIKDLVAFLRLAENPRDIVAALRVLLLLPGIGQKKAHVLVEMLETDVADVSAWNSYKPPKATQGLWPKLLELMHQLAAKSARRDVAADVNLIRIFYGPLLEDRYDNAAARIRDLKQLEIVASRFQDRISFLTDMTLDPPSSTQDFADDPHLDEDYLILSTIHSAKGLEWDTVFVIHAADGNIPSDMATKKSEDIEEELRLFYVALTRAKRSLYVCYPHRYFHGRNRGAFSYADLTRFLPDEILPLFDRETASQESIPDELEQTRINLTTEEVRDRIKNIWGEAD